MITGARFSECGAYRYRLWRQWGAMRPAIDVGRCRTLAFVMLNPSTADEFTNDPTVERCQRRAMALGFDRLEVLNLFALRSHDPRALVGHPDPVGPENDAAIAVALDRASLVVCAWGSHPAADRRAADVLAAIHAAGLVPHALRINGDGAPGHPLYIPLDVRPTPWLGPAGALAVS